MSQDVVTLYHAPNTRSSGVLLLLEELGIPYKLHVLDRVKAELQSPEFLAINPLGKVPALSHGDAIITESVAIMLYLADAFPAAGLAPRIGDPLRGPYLRWMTMYAAAWEPAMIDRALKRDPGQRAMSVYGDFESLYQTLLAQLKEGPYFLGAKFTTLDVLWGSALTWMTMFKLIPEHPTIAAYLAHVSSRPALSRMRAKDQELAAKLSA